MRFVYQEWDGSSFPTQEHLRLFENFMDYVLEYGQAAMEALRDLSDDPDQRLVIEKWIEEGLLDKVGVHFRLTPRAINTMQRRAIMEIFRNLRPGAPDGHETPRTGPGGERGEGTRPYQFGDAVSDIDLHETLRRALLRGGAGLPIQLREDDVEVALTESRATCSTVILLDMSGSMSRWNRFANAKRCAMAVHALIRQRFPLDTVDVVGFASGAEVVPEHRLPLLMPKRVTLFDPVIRMRVPIPDMPKAPQHFTNLHMGLLTARRLLARRGGRNKQVFIITDGQPTAHVDGGDVHLLYPPDRSTTLATLGEAMMMSRQGIRFATFALIEDYDYMDWVGFVDQMTKLTRGVAFYCTGDNLASCVVESFLTGRKTKSFLG